MCWEQNAPPGQVMALVRQNLGPNRSLPEGYHDRWDDLAKRWVASELLQEVEISKLSATLIECVCAAGI